MQHCKSIDEQIDDEISLKESIKSEGLNLEGIKISLAWFEELPDLFYATPNGEGEIIEEPIETGSFLGKLLGFRRGNLNES